MSAGGRLYKASELQRLLAPKSVAIVGASTREGSFGMLTFKNLHRFAGPVWTVNPRYDELYGQPCYASVRDLPEAPDCVVLVTPRDAVRGVLEECADIGAGGVLVFASGFGEMGEKGKALERENALLAHRAGMPLIGPNALGFVNYSNGGAVTFHPPLDFERGFDAEPAQRRVGIVAQSGALGFSLTQGMRRGQFFSHALACGNSSDVDVADCVAFMAEDPEAKAIAVILEGAPAPDRFEAAIKQAAAAGKATVVCKMARGEKGAAAAASHTGSLAGAHDAYRSMVERAGGIFVDELEALVDTARLFAKSPPPVAEGTCIVCTSGGAGVFLTDACEDAGVPLPHPSPEVEKVLKARIPEFGSAVNPVDVTAQVVSDRQSLIDCLEAVLDQDDYGSLVVPHPIAIETSIPRIQLMGDLAKKAGKPVIVPWMSSALEGPGLLEAEASDSIVVFHNVRHCMEGVASWWRWHARHVEPIDKPRLTEPSAGLSAHLAASAGGAVTEREAKAILAGYGVPVIEEKAASSAEEAGRLASSLGFPVVMKIDSPDIAHKTEAGGIALNLGSAEAVAAEFEAMTARVKRHAPKARIEGVLVQRMAPKGVEIVVGARRDPAFGPLVVVGLGGVLVELMRDSVAAPAPVTPREALDMLARLRGAAILDGFRDLPGVDRDRLAEIVARVSEFAFDAGDALEELDVNPLICRGEDIVAVDALIIPAAAAEPDRKAG
ncbi:acetate--CoA ligase family protein [uncultured Albimonas sp.]|uniref:acetate--CoA ligase family protein n=1 Tax=uncultured Albimonas sp. TaxID=1331701 RepID=UPI0030EE12E0